MTLAFPKMIDLLSGHASNASHIVSTPHTSVLPAVDKNTATSAPITSAKQTSSKRNSEHRSSITSNNAAMVVYRQNNNYLTYCKDSH